MHETSANIKELIAPTFNFVFLVSLLTYFLRKPVKEMVANRRLAIKAQVDEAQAQKAEADRNYKEFSERLKFFEAEAKQTLEKARADGESLKVKIIADAKASAQRIVKEAEATALANIEEYKDQLRRDTIARAVELAERMIRDGISSDDQKRIVTEYVGKVR